MKKNWFFNLIILCAILTASLSGCAPFLITQKIVEVPVPDYLPHMAFPHVGDSYGPRLFTTVPDFVTRKDDAIYGYVYAYSGKFFAEYRVVGYGNVSMIFVPDVCYHINDGFYYSEYLQAHFVNGQDDSGPVVLFTYCQ